jgi:hypothetical protein
VVDVWGEIVNYGNIPQFTRPYGGLLQVFEIAHRVCTHTGAES